MTDFSHLRPPGTMSSSEVCKLADVTYRQLDRWVREGHIDGQGPQGSGTQRAWTPAQLARVREIHTALEGAKAILRCAGLPTTGIGASA